MQNTRLSFKFAIFNNDNGKERRGFAGSGN